MLNKNILFIYYFYFIIFYVVLQFYLWFRCYSPLFMSRIMYNNEFQTKENAT